VFSFSLVLLAILPIAYIEAKANTRAGMSLPRCNVTKTPFFLSQRRNFEIASKLTSRNRENPKEVEKNLDPPRKP